MTRSELEACRGGFEGNGAAELDVVYVISVGSDNDLVSGSKWTTVAGLPA
jgi:hypothetical protein